MKKLLGIKKLKVQKRKGNHIACDSETRLNKATLQEESCTGQEAEQLMESQQTDELLLLFNIYTLIAMSAKDTQESGIMCELT